MMMIAILLSFKGAILIPIPNQDTKFNNIKGTPQQQPTASASVAFFFLFMLIFGGSVNCIPWVYAPEILPLHARAKGYAIPALIQ